MRGILADVNAEGHLERIIDVWRGTDDWSLIWDELNLTVETFEGLGFDKRMPDSEVWRACQGLGLILITANRNHDGPTSLEAVIRAENTLDRLPVITIADAERLMHEWAYAGRTAVKILDYLVDGPLILGAGRLYAP